MDGAALGGALGDPVRGVVDGDQLGVRDGTVVGGALGASDGPTVVVDAEAKRLARLTAGGMLLLGWVWRRSWRGRRRRRGDDTGRRE